ncbi:MAG: ATP-binding protein [Bacteroidaceae bacterium]|nr:ATP-binding protein [Bacteroidaceae bacterium]
MEYTIDEYLNLYVHEDEAMYVHEDEEMYVVRREISAEMSEAMKYFPVITVTGPRQSGKTTLIRSHFPRLTYYTLENLDTRALATTDPVAFLNRHPDGMILDEVQNVPELLSYIQGIVDENPKKRYILSGSNNFTLLKSMTQSLAGRSCVFELMPMSLKEVAGWARHLTLDELLFNGLFPAICTKRNAPKYLYPAYIKTYIERDVRLLTNVKDLMLFRTFLRLCAGRIGSVFNASELANEVGVSANTILSWISILQTSYVVYLLPPYFENSRKRLTKSPKIYFCDTGLACSLLGIHSPNELSSHAMRGHLFENMIVMEAYKSCLNTMTEASLYFYRDSNQNEVDLLRITSSGMKAFEVKSAATFSTYFEKTLKALPSWVKPNITDRTIIYSGAEERKEGDILLRNYLSASEENVY